ncbi:SRPBCC family protein [Cryobacterium sp. Y57]|uniref:SRPBCC family protein n=1 Tax=Cryobacterium sp. Y57 TaxID=2048287 RepID=UPI000CE399B5|nr:SRPBCC family protein [Cryobacterium sp. Y57]
MSETRILSHQESVIVEASATFLYDLLSDITRTGEWSPVCTSCWWDDEAEAGRVGAWFTGRNELPHRTWQTRSEVVRAERGHEFAWVVGGSFVRWSFSFTAPENGTETGTENGTGTMLTESWDFLPDGIAMFEEKFGEDAHAQITDRTQQALEGIPKTLRAIKRIAEVSRGSGERALA